MLLDLGADALLKDKRRRTPVDLAANEEVKVEVKAAFAEHCEQVDMTGKKRTTSCSSSAPVCMPPSAVPYTRGAAGWRRSLSQ